MKCLCGYEGNPLTKEWINLEFTINIESNGLSNAGYNTKESIQPNKKMYICPKCGTVKINI